MAMSLPLSPRIRATVAAPIPTAKGWAALTAAQRRGHLLGIFYCESVESRERRAAKAVEDALKAARKLS